MKRGFTLLGTGVLVAGMLLACTLSVEDDEGKGRAPEGMPEPQFTLGVEHTHNKFSIRLEISSSNFPRYDRNLNTGGNNYDESEPVLARNRVHHGPDYLSKIRLPVSR